MDIGGIMGNLIIIGGGPAGVSAALYARRGNVDVTIIHKGALALEKAFDIDNYYGVPNTSGKQLYDLGLKQAEDLGVKIIEAEVNGLEFNEKYDVLTADNKRYSADAIIIATGTYRAAPPLRGLSQFEGRGVSYCATCDGFFFKDKKIGIIGNSAYAAHEAEYLRNLSADLTIYTNGDPILDESLNNYKIVTDKLKVAHGSERLSKIEGVNGEYEVDGLFIALGSAGSVDFARKLGIAVENNKIVVDENMRTNIPGIYACGDCNKGILQIARAVYEGALAGSDVIKYLKKK